jgi:hypothetical protein
MLFFKSNAAIFLIATCAILYWPKHLFASKNEGAHPIEISSNIASARNTGWARLTVWGFEVYDARLWTGPEFKAESHELHRFALEISYLRYFDTAALADRSIKEMRSLAPMTDAQAVQWHQVMHKIFPAISPGDRLVGLHTPGVGARFTFNGKTTGEVSDPEFARLFFGIWLNPKTSEPRIRRALLGIDTPTAR